MPVPSCDLLRSLVCKPKKRPIVEDDPDYSVGFLLKSELLDPVYCNVIGQDCHIVRDISVCTVIKQKFTQSTPCPLDKQQGLVNSQGLDLFFAPVGGVANYANIAWGQGFGFARGADNKLATGCAKHHDTPSVDPFNYVDFIGVDSEDQCRFIQINQLMILVLGSLGAPHSLRVSVCTRPPQTIFKKRHRSGVTVARRPRSIRPSVGSVSKANHAIRQGFNYVSSAGNSKRGRIDCCRRIGT